MPPADYPQATVKTTCLVVDDHPVVRDGLKLALDAEPDMKLTDAVGSDEAALEAVAQTRPSVVILDVAQGKTDGLAAAEQIAAAGTAVVVFTASGEPRLVTDALAAGARGYVLKASPTGDLCRAIRVVAAGAAYVDPTLPPAVLLARQRARLLQPHEQPLSERQVEILRSLSFGLHTDQVGARLGLSQATVKTALREASHKLNARGRTHAVAIALRAKLID